MRAFAGRGIGDSSWNARAAAAAARGGAAEPIREARHQHRDGSRRGWDQRRPRHAAGNAHGVARAPGPGDGGRGRPDPRHRDHPLWQLGTLAVGKAADLVLLVWDKLAHPYLDPETSVLEAVIQRAKSEGVDLVMVAGEVVYEGGYFTRVDRDAALHDLHESLQRARSPTTRSSGASCRKRSCRMYGASTPTISTPKRTCPTTVPARGCERSVRNAFYELSHWPVVGFPLI